jgi:hypothetical protein
MINSLIVNDATSDGNAPISIDQFQQILTTYNDPMLSNTEKVKELSNLYH